MIFDISSRLFAPTTIRPFAKKVGVPLTPAFWPSARSACHSEAYFGESRHSLNRFALEIHHATRLPLVA